MGVMMEILSWLPIKYLSQVQLVCKEWRLLIRDRYFMEKHMRHSSFDHNWHNSNDPSWTPADYTSSYIHGCDGLIIMKNLSSKKYVLWNPAIKRSIVLPDPHHYSYGVAMFPIAATGDYRVVSFYKDKKGEVVGCEVMTTGPSMCWTRLEVPHTNVKGSMKVVPTQGAFHCVISTKVGKGITAEIVTLDVEAERFTVNHLPVTAFGAERIWELDWDGKLGLVGVVGENLEVMELEDYKKQRWGEMKKEIPLPFLKESDYKENIYPLLKRGGEIWFWLEKTRIFRYSMETGEITVVEKSKSYSLDSQRMYVYKPSLVSIQVEVLKIQNGNSPWWLWVGCG